VDAWAEANTRGLWQVGFGKRNRRFDTAAWYTPPSFRTYPTVDDASFDAFIDARAIGIVGNIEVRLGASVADTAPTGPASRSAASPRTSRSRARSPPASPSR
jgi:hypothetical protein